MFDTNELTELAYMRAAVLAHNPVHSESWDAETIRAVYHTITFPAISYDAWLERMNAALSTESMSLANDRFIAFAEQARAAGADFNIVAAQN
jgi:hypothetical protein